MGWRCQPMRTPRSSKLFNFYRWGCAYKPGVKPALATWWGKKPPKADRLNELCASADILITRGSLPPGVCRAPPILGSDAFAEGGAGDVYSSAYGWKIVWGQPIGGPRALVDA